MIFYDAWRTLAASAAPANVEPDNRAARRAGRERSAPAPRRWYGDGVVMAFVHPAAVAPFLLGRRRRRLLDGPALVAGSVAADFEYFGTLSAVQRVHPDPVASGLFGVAAGLALVAVLDVLGPTLADALPMFAQERVGPALTRRRWRAGITSWLVSVVSVVVGALTHVAWDAVAEHNGALHHAVPWRVVASWSTPVGVVVLVAAFVLAPRLPVAQGARCHPKLLALLGAGAAVGAASCAALRDRVLGGDLRDVMAAASGGAIFGVVAAAGAALLVSRRTPQA